MGNRGNHFFYFMYLDFVKTPYGYTIPYGYKGRMPVFSSILYDDPILGCGYLRNQLTSLGLDTEDNAIFTWRWMEFATQEEYEQAFDEAVNDIYNKILSDKKLLKEEQDGKEE